MSERKVEQFFQVQHSEDACDWWVFPVGDSSGQLEDYFKNNVDVGEGVVVKIIKGIRVEDPSEEFEYTVKEVE